MCLKNGGYAFQFLGDENSGENEQNLTILKPIVYVCRVCALCATTEAMLPSCSSDYSLLVSQHCQISVLVLITFYPAGFFATCPCHSFSLFGFIHRCQFLACSSCCFPPWFIVQSFLMCTVDPPQQVDIGEGASCGVDGQVLRSKENNQNV